MSNSPDRPADGGTSGYQPEQGTDYEQGAGQDSGYQGSGYQQGSGQGSGYQQGTGQGSGQGSGYQQGSGQGSGYQQGTGQGSEYQQGGGQGSGYQRGTGQDTGYQQGTNYPQGQTQTQVKTRDRDDRAPSRAAEPRARHGAPVERRTAEIVGTVLAGTLMILGGLWSIVMGIVVLSTAHVYVHTQPSGYTYRFTLHGWGWAELIFGIVLVAAGSCVLLGMAWARWVGIVLAVISAIGNFMFIPFTPVWSILMIAVSAFIIWALAAPRRYPGEI
jgi:hypothetical protein